MKKIIISVLSAALVFASCQKEAALVENGTKTVSFTATTPETRTSFAPKDGDSYPVLWSGDEKVSVSYNMTAPKSSGNTLAASADSKTATFSIDITADTEASEHNFYAVCPSSALLGVSADRGFNVQVPQSQVPGDGTCDESAQVIFANYSSSSFPTSATFNFKHIVAYGNLSITLPSGVSEISSITLESPVDIAGRFYYTAEGESTVNSGSKVITLNTTKTSDVFFACLPADLSGQSLKVVIAAGGNTYTKNISLTGKALNFKKGHVSKFSVDMSGVSADAKVVYNLVTDPTTLKEGDKVIIAAKDADVALSTTQNGNNRAAADITKYGNTVVNPGAAVQILTLEKGTLDNTCAFNTGAGYLYAASSSGNQLKTQTTLDANGSFRISYADGVTTVMAKGKNSRNLLQYNNSNSIFSCYDSNQKEVVIYSDGKGTGAQLFSTAVDETPITPETPTFSSLAELVSKLEPTTDGTPVNVTLTNEKIVNIYTTGNYRNGIFLQVGERQIEIYCKDVPDAWVEGGTVSGTLKECVWKNYNGTWELCPTNWTELTYTAPAGGGNAGTVFNQTYSYGSFDGWSLTNYTDKNTYYLVPATGDESIATISGIFSGKTITSDVVVYLSVATFGNGNNPTSDTFSLYADEGCTIPVNATQSGSLPTSSTYTTVLFTISQSDAASLTKDLAIKISKPGKQIRFQSIRVKFDYK